MTPAAMFAVAAVALGGALLSVQAGLNAAVARALGGAATAAALSFGVGFVVLVALAWARDGAPSGGALAALPWWGWTGGVLGASFMVAAVWAVPQVGVLTVMAAVVLGQLVAALALDAVGAFGAPPQPIGLRRLAAVALTATGVWLSRA